MEQNNIHKSRLDYIDIAKGILIMCLVYGHLAIISKWQGLDDIVINKWIPATVPLYSSFFMPAFFILSGYCSTFKIKFKVYIWKTFKILIIPAIILKLLAGYGLDAILGNSLSWNHFLDLSTWFTTGMDAPWFIFSLFWAKVLYWPIANLNSKWQLSLTVIICICGYALHRFNVPDYQYHQHTMILLPWLCFGNICKRYKEIIDKWLLSIGIFGAVSIFIQNILHIKFGWFIPTVDAYINVHWRDLILWYVNVISGTAAIVCLSKYISRNNILQTFGKGSLFIYLLDTPVRISIIQLTLRWGGVCRLYYSVSMYIPYIIICSLFCIVLFLNKTYI